MARVFVSDCLKKIENRNELVVLAAKHARTIPMSKNLTPGSWKNRAVEALRHIESGKATEESIIDAWYKSQRPKTTKLVEREPD